MHYVSRHGFGYSVFEHVEDGINSEVWVYVAMDASIKFTAMKMKNRSGRPRRLSATGYVEWVLGDLRPKTSMQVITEIDPKTGAIFARNPYNSEFVDRTAFFDAGEATRTVTGDRTEFLGRNGTLQRPAAMTRSRLSGRVGAALDPCGAIQVPFDLADGQEREIIFRLGAGRNSEDAGNLVRRFRGSVAARGALEKVWGYWNRTLGAVQVETPDRSVNMLANGWLLYQTLACRLWARSGYYQSAGAFGFRDQLQDTMALIHSEPRLLREHLLLCAAHQSGREMSSIGGIPRRGGACVRAVRTIFSGCPLPRAATCSRPETPGCWMKPSASSKTARSTRTRTPITIFPVRPRKRQVCTITACGPF
jgi:cellobiose phosphorylase